MVYVRMCTRAANAQDINMIMFEFMCDINFVYISVEHVLQNVISRESVRSSSRNELQVLYIEYIFLHLRMRAPYLVPSRYREKLFKINSI